MDINGICALCSQYGKLSFEHVPPQSAFNDKPIYIQTDEHLSDENSKFFGKRMKSNRGFGSNTLCESCNNNTGSWYAEDFGEFARQGMEILKNCKSLPLVSGEYEIKPLNVFKQILTMFMSADKGGYFRTETKLPEFILDRYSTDFPNNLKLFIYSNASPFKRMIGHTINMDLGDPSFGTQKWAEINFQPFGYLLAEDSRPAHGNMLDITTWHKVKYDGKYQIDMNTCYLDVNSAIIGTYGN